MKVRLLLCSRRGRVQGALRDNPIFNALSPAFVQRRAVGLDAPFDLPGGIVAELFTVPGKVALYLERDGADLAGDAEDTVGLRLSDGSGSVCYFIPGCAEFSTGLADRLRSADLVLFDGTLWTDDEMIQEGSGTKSGQRMGHMSVAGPSGTIATFLDIGVQRKVFIHLNNSNPLLLDDSPERAVAEGAGWEVAYDGMEIVL